MMLWNERPHTMFITVITNYIASFPTYLRRRKNFSVLNKISKLWKLVLEYLRFWNWTLNLISCCLSNINFRSHGNHFFTKFENNFLSDVKENIGIFNNYSKSISNSVARKRTTVHRSQNDCQFFRDHARHTLNSLDGLWDLGLLLQKLGRSVRQFTPVVLKLFYALTPNYSIQFSVDPVA